MIRRSTAPWALLAGLTVLLLASCDPPQQPPRLLAPAPTELVESEENEGEMLKAREMWEELRHRAPSGVSWRAVEAENLRRNREARAALLRTAAAVPSRWRERGSFDQTGRTRVTAVAGDGKTLLVGSDFGGVFSGLPGGRRWVPRAAGLDIGVRSLVVVPGRPEVWIASGETGPLYVTTDGGATWSRPKGGPVLGEPVERIVRDPARPRTVYVLATSGGKYTLYRSDNGGLQLSIASSGLAQGQPDLWIDRVKGGALYLAVRRELRRSVDRGATFKLVGRLPAQAQDVILVGSEAGAPTFYVTARGPGSLPWRLFVSEDGGRSWRAGAPMPFFWEGLTASITDPKLVFIGGIDGYRSADAGRSLQTIHRWQDYYQSPDTRLHADVQGIDCALYRGKETVFFNTDGGTYLSQNGGKSVRNVTRYGFGNSEYYSILTSANDSELIASGSQDQGFQVSRPGSGTVLGFDQVALGDYGSLTSSDGTHNMLYSSTPFSITVQLREGSPELWGIAIPAPPEERRSFWLAPLAADLDDPEVVYVGDRRIWRVERSVTQGFTAEALPHDFGPGPDGDYVAAFAISPADRSRWYAGTVHGRLWHSRDRGRTWTLSRELESFFASDVLPSPTDPDVCYVAGSGYFDDEASVYRTTNGGETWEPMAEGLPQTLVNALAFDDPGRQELYAATQAGPFRYDEGAGVWVSLLDAGAPLVLYRDVEGVPAAGVVRFATYGRGIWDYTP